MADITFSNNLGQIKFDRCLIGITDNWHWNGRGALWTKGISIDGYWSRADEGMDGVLVQDGGDRGEPGTLSLPWTTLEQIKIQNLDIGDGVWGPLVPVRATFVDDNPQKNLYTIHFFDLELHNPRVNLGLPNRRIIDDYPQMALAGGLMLSDTDLRNGAMRTRQNEDLMSITVTGSFQVDDAKLPRDIINILSQRNVSSAEVAHDSDIPLGYPKVFRLDQAIREMHGDLALETVFVARSRLVWNVEQGVAQVNIEMMCQPQKLKSAV